MFKTSSRQVLTTAAALIFTSPVCLRTHKQSLSYGGKLKFTIYHEAKLPGVAGERKRANVVLQGGEYRNLTVQYFTEDPLSGANQAFVIPMREVSVVVGDFTWCML